MDTERPERVESSSSRTDLTLEAPHGPEQPRRETKRSARDRWLLLGLLLLCVGIGLGAGIGIGIGMGSRFEVAKAVAVRATDCGVQREHAAAIRSLGTPLQPEPAHPAAAIPSEKAPANDSASSAPPPDPCGTIAPQPTPQRRPARPQGASAAPAVGSGAAVGNGAARSPSLGPDLHEALSLLRAAQQALRAADATRALSLLDEMARRMPDVLVEEREVTRTLAHCAARDVDNARLTAAALREAGTARVYAHRLSESCVGPEPTPESLLDEMRRRALY